MDEFERATEELGLLIGELTDDEFQTVCNPEAENEEFRSIQAVVNHVVRAGYGHANYLRVAFSADGSRVEVPFGTRSESVEQLAAMLAYMAATLDGRWEMTDEQIESVEIKSRWGPTYDLEQMLEHVVVHVLRHRRQIERFLWESRSGGVQGNPGSVPAE
ncbi:MAG TPA: DinB family protein [Thermoanaerobaculia bacterium]|nr:DinB family protein [Thermoanaerobaculia bacterium]